MNYWFIWLIFVPVGVFIFDRTITDAYGDHAVMKMILDFFGLLNMTGNFGYNSTWWFYSCIIVLYLLYPLLHKKLCDNWLLIISLSVLISLCGKIPIISPISNYLLPFVGGIMVARIPTTIFDKLRVSDTIIAFVLLSVVRNFSGMICVIDTLLCLTLAIFLYQVRPQGLVQKFFIQLGKHSQNIFLFHTFIYLYWFNEETYITRNPVIIFLQLTAICYVISIEFIKQKVGFYKLCK